MPRRAARQSPPVAALRFPPPMQYCSIFCSSPLSVLYMYITRTFDCTARGMRARMSEYCIAFAFALHFKCCWAYVVFCRVVSCHSARATVCCLCCVVSCRAVEISLRAERAPLLRAAPPPPPQFFDSKLNSTQLTQLELNSTEFIALHCSNSLRSF